MEFRHEARATSSRARPTVDTPPAERQTPGEPPGDEPSPEAVEFVRFCYRRRPVGWPDLYDEMCAVAARAAFNGWGYAELAEHGIAFTVPGLPRLAALTEAVLAEERAAGREAPVAHARRGAEGGGDRPSRVARRTHRLRIAHAERG